MQTPRANTKSEFMLLNSICAGLHLVSPFAIREHDYNADTSFPGRHDRLAELLATHNAHELVSCPKNCHNLTCMNLEGISEAAMMTGNPKAQVSTKIASMWGFAVFCRKTQFLTGNPAHSIRHAAELRDIQSHSIMYYGKRLLLNHLVSNPQDFSRRCGKDLYM